MSLVEALQILLWKTLGKCPPCKADKEAALRVLRKAQKEPPEEPGLNNYNGGIFNV